jgi:hypothetical protein
MSGYGAVPEEVIGLVVNSAAQEAVAETQESIEKARVLLEQGPLTLRAMCMIGGIGLTTSGALSIINIFSLLNPLHLLIEIYLCVFGVIILILEMQDTVCTAGLRDNIRTYAKFLTYISGRAAFYVFAGSLSLAQFPNFVDTVVGGYLVGMGFLCKS